ncbi:aminodeoxychorismate synthase component I [uncultured Legionella sp.]|uniref:aminodeoxychorismate synthase component I n=1 Tax=uncultured Legionella sp. TaxID=210934 RepID=UPI002603817C|nr:aminodeoxychorismate synthase component I [uncultured Legionella sp.]
MIKELILELNYHPFLQDSYQKLVHLPGFILLESTDNSLGRYDILSACPYDRLVIDNNKPLDLSDFDKLRQIISTESSPYAFPFQGGAIGYISYDLGAQLFNIYSTPQPGLAGMPLVDMGLYDWAIIVDHQLRKVTLFAANEHASTHTLIQHIIDLWNTSAPKSEAFAVNSDFYPLMTEEHYKNSLAAIYDSLRMGRAYQVNYTQPFHAQFQGDPWQIYRAVSRYNPVPFSAFMTSDNMDILSFSPERFLLHDERTLLTSPIKGTVGRSSDFDVDEQLKAQLLSCPKNRAENIMIVDLMRNDFGKIAVPGSVTVSNLCALQSFNSVHHLVSDIHGVRIEQINPFDAFLSCFPGGSITGAPKREAMNIIREQESYGRGVYCGSIGYFSRHGRFDTNIAIRTITARQNILYLAAGGGIVIDSQWEDEYRECYTKIAAIINGLK